MGSLDILAERHRRALEGGNDRPVSTLRTSGQAASKPLLRLRSRIPAVDQLTGGGFVRGAAYLIHGGPGCGKSTLMAQVCMAIPRSVYVSSEESADQVGRRFVRLGSRDQLICAEKDIRAALEPCDGAPFVVVDSVSTMKPDIATAAETCVDFARGTGAAIVMICHETKSGVHAGPRQLEHLIDATLAMVRQPQRLLIVEKNRFGPAPLTYQLTMTDGGLT